MQARTQYLTALKLDPSNAEARASLGYVLYRSDRPSEGLLAENQALAASSNYPEALYYKGLILLNGLHRSTEASGAFRGYLDAAPFGSRRAEVEKLLRQAGPASSSPPSP